MFQRYFKFSTLIIGFLLSCTTPTNVQLQVAAKNPTWVKAEFQLDGSTPKVHVTWQASAKSYKVYRQLGTGGWVLLTTGLAATSFDDTSYYSGLVDPTKPEPVSYSVQAAGVTASRALSNPTAPVVLNTKASLFTVAGTIHLQWQAHPEAQSYKVYRYPNGNDGSNTPVMIKDALSASAGTMTWDDVSVSGGDPKVNQPYYYLVTWVKDSVEYGTSDMGGYYTMGANSTQTDLYEPANEDWSFLPADATLFNSLQPPLVYSFADGNGGQVNDTDWYKAITDAANATVVTVNIPNDTAYQNGELEFKFRYNNTDYAAQGLVKGDNTFIFSTYAPGASGNQTVYFNIQPHLFSPRNVVSPYTVTVSSSL